MKKECVICGKEKLPRHFAEGEDTCNRCRQRQHEAALAFSAKAERDDILSKNRLRIAELAPNAQAEREKAPPREYPWPFRGSRE